MNARADPARAPTELPAITGFCVSTTIAESRSFGRPRALSTHQSERLARLYAFGRPQREIAQLLGVSKSTVARAVHTLKVHAG